MKQMVHTELAPGAIGPYSQAVKVASPEAMLFLSGQIPLDPATGQLAEGGITAQVERALRNLQGVIEAAGFSLSDVVRTTIFLASMADFPVVNEVYGRFFAAPFPARVTVEVKGLPRSALVEIDALCVR
jgi:2-iminobutanoate/2-iminopropanoate deaminase